MDLRTIEEARYEAGQIVAEALKTRLPLQVAVMLILMDMKMRNLPLPEDALAFATRGHLSDDSVLPPGRPSNQVALARFDAVAREFADQIKSRK